MENVAVAAVLLPKNSVTPPTLLVIVAVPALFLGLWLSPWWFTAGPLALLLGFGTYLFHNTLQTHATQMAPTVRGTAVALFAFCLFAGQALGVSLSRFALDRLGFAPLLAIPAVALVAVGAWLARAIGARAA